MKRCAKTLLRDATRASVSANNSNGSYSAVVRNGASFETETGGGYMNKIAIELARAWALRLIGNVHTVRNWTHEDAQLFLERAWLAGANHMDRWHQDQKRRRTSLHDEAMALIAAQLGRHGPRRMVWQDLYARGTFDPETRLPMDWYNPPVGWGA